VSGKPLRLKLKTETVGPITFIFCLTVLVNCCNVAPTYPIWWAGFKNKRDSEVWTDILSLLQAWPDTLYDRFDLYPAISAGVGNKQTLARRSPCLPCGTCPATLFQKPGIKACRGIHMPTWSRPGWESPELVANICSSQACWGKCWRCEAVRGPSRRFHGGYLSLKRCWKRGARIRSLWAQCKDSPNLFGVLLD